MAALTSAGITFGDATSQTTAATAAALVTTANVLNATAGASAGAVGTYAFLSTPGGTPQVTFGNTTAGSGLRVAGAAARFEVPNNTWNLTTSTTVSGTWRAMGDLRFVSSGCGTIYGGTVFLRIS